MNLSNNVFSISPQCRRSYLLTPWSRVLLEKLTGFQLDKKFPTFYGTRRFITAFTKNPPPVPTLSQLDTVHTLSSYFLKIHLIHLNIILPSTPGCLKWSLYLRFLTKTLYTPPRSPIRATCAAHHILDFITRTILVEEYRSFSSSLCSFLHITHMKEKSHNFYVFY